MLPKFNALLGPEVENSSDKWKPKTLKSLANTKYHFIIERPVGKTTLTQWMADDGTKILRVEYKTLGPLVVLSKDSMTDLKTVTTFRLQDTP